MMEDLIYVHNNLGLFLRNSSQYKYETKLWDILRDDFLLYDNEIFEIVRLDKLSFIFHWG